MSEGVLFLIVGNSGSGKDAVMDYAAKKVKDLFVAKRSITRPSGIGEEYNSILEEEFNEKDYFLSWKSYNKYYGVGFEVLQGLKKGSNYLVNVSRQVLNNIKSKWNNTFIVEFRIPLDLTRKRLEERGRENSEEIKERLNRALNAPVVNSDLIIDTSNPDVSIAGRELIKFVERKTI